MGEKIIFLDIDGPMIPNWSREHIESGKAHILKDFFFLSGFSEEAKSVINRLVELTGASVVTNSTHNNGTGYYTNDLPGDEHIANLFEANGMKSCLRSSNYRTPFRNKDRDFYNCDRDLAVTMWLKDHEVDNYVIFDDATYDYTDGKHGAHLVKSPTSGLTEEHYLKGLEILT